MFFKILGEFGFKENDTQLYCVIQSGTLDFPPILIIYITAFAIPALIITYSYTNIWYYVWKNNKYFSETNITW